MPKKLIKKRITISEESHKLLRFQTDSVEATVYQALNYSSNSPKSVRIRKLAMEKYDGMIEETYIRPMKETDILNQYS